MMTFGMTAGNDNAIIWLIEIDTESPIYLCAGHNTASVSLSTGSETRVYSNGIQKGSLSVYEQSIPAEQAGGVGSRNGFTFAIANFGSYDINDFYPASGGYDVTMKPARLGWIWTGATTTAEITWLYEGFIDNFESRTDAIVFDVTESNDLEILTLPPFKVQKDFNDGHSYFPKAPEESYGLPLPIVYGDFTANEQKRGWIILAPGVVVDMERQTIAGSCHEAHTTYYDDFTLYRAFTYIAGSADTYMELEPVTGGESNTPDGHFVYLLPTGTRSLTIINGNLTLWNKQGGAITDKSDIQVLNDKNYQSDLTLGNNEDLGVQFLGDFDQSFGNPNIGLTDIQLVVEWKTSVNGERRYLDFKFYNYIKSGGAGYTTATGQDSTTDGTNYKTTYYEIGNVTDGKSNSDLPWSWSELLGLQWVIRNTSGASGGVAGDVKIKNVYLKVNYIVLSNVTIYLPRVTDGGRRSR